MSHEQDKHNGGRDRSWQAGSSRFNRAAGQQRGEGGPRGGRDFDGRGGERRGFDRDGGRRSFDRSERGWGRDGERRQGWGRDGERRGFDRDGGRRSFDRSERGWGRDGERRQGWGRDGERRDFESREGGRREFDGRGERRSFDRSERGWGRDGERRGFDRRDGERRGFDRRDGERRGFDRDGGRRSFDRSERGWGRDGERRGFDRREGGRRDFAGREERRTFDRAEDGREVRTERDKFAARQAERSQRESGYGAAKRDEEAQRQAPSQGLYAGPDFPADVTDKLLDKPTRMRLRTLSERSAEVVAKHLVMVQRHLATDPELAWAHAEAAVRNAGRVDVVREAAALAAYASGRFTDTLREVRALRRLSGRHVHIAIEADSERALGRPEKALDIIAGAGRYSMDVIERAELAMVASGVRADLGQLDAGLLAVEQALASLQLDEETMLRLQSVRADRLRDLGRDDEADALVAQYGLDEFEEEDVEVYDAEEDFDESDAGESESDAGDSESDAAAGYPQATDLEETADADADAAVADAAELADAADVEDAELLKQAQSYDVDAEVDELLAQVEVEAGEQEDLFDIEGLESGEAK